MQLQIKFFKNNTIYNLSCPNLLQMNYNERIDNLKCDIVHQPTKPDVKIKDLVLIQDLDHKIDDLYMIVCNYSIVEDSLDNTTYSCKLQLCSETKDLEGYICPQISITPLKDNPRSIYWYLNKFNEEYGAKIRVYDEELETTRWTNKWTFSTGTATHPSVYDKFNGRVAPELQWNTPTFKEVLTDLMMVEDCIPILRNNVIDYIDLTETKNEITHYNYKTWSNDLSNYASDMQMNMQNVMQTKIDGVNNTTTSVEYIPFNSNDYTMTSENLILKTKYPILRITKLELITFSDETEYDSHITQPISYRKNLLDIDGYSLVYESQEYQTKQVLYTTGDWDSSKTGAYYSQYQNYCIYYTRGSNEILGFDDTTKKYGVLSFTYKTKEWLGMITAHRKFYARSGLDTGAYGPSFYQYYFIIEYETTANQVYKTSKDEDIAPHVIIDSQTNSWVDALTQGNLEKQKANRMSNETIMINQRWIPTYTYNPINIGDYWVDNNGDKNIAYQVEWQIYPDHIDVNAYLCKNYVLKNYFTSIDSKVRTWKNATDEAFEKQQLTRYFCEFSKSKHDEVGLPSMAYHFYQSINDPTIAPLKYLAIQTKDSNNNRYPANAKFYAVDLVSRLIGNSLVFTGGFDNNTIVEKQMQIGANDIEQYTAIYGDDYERKWIRIKPYSLIDDKGIKMQNTKYVDSNFEFDSAIVTLGEDIRLTTEEITHNATIPLSDIRNFTEKVCQYPVIDSSSITGFKVQRTLNYHKDNKEIPTYTLQFEYASDTRDIYFTTEWLKNERSIRTVTKPSVTIQLVDFKYGKQDRNGTPTDWTMVAEDVGTLTSIRIKLSGSSIDLTNKALSIGNGTKNWLVVDPKITGNATSYSFYMNILQEKNKAIYSESDHKIKVGEI